jgi:hypothetical protein
MPILSMRCAGSPNRSDQWLPCRRAGGGEPGRGPSQVRAQMSHPRGKKLDSWLMSRLALVMDVQPEGAASLYYTLNAHLEVDRLLSAVSALPQRDRWETQARLLLRSDIYRAVRALCIDVLARGEADRPGGGPDRRVGGGKPRPDDPGTGYPARDLRCLTGCRDHLGGGSPPAGKHGQRHQRAGDGRRPAPVAGRSRHTCNECAEVTASERGA